MSDFIGVYKNAFSKPFCDLVIDHFEKADKAGFTQNRQKTDGEARNRKDDVALFGHDVNGLPLVGAFSRQFYDKFWSCHADYVSRFSVLDTEAAQGVYSIKVQRTQVGGGYHVWHFESDSRTTCNRTLAWMVYLNDVEKGGETEFLYQHERLQAEQGTLVIWPASFTHAHRGNPPLSNTKYVITGWVEF